MALPFPDRLVLVDMWETLRRTLVSAEPDLVTAIEKRTASNWRATPPRERAALAVAILLDLAPDNPAARRRARSILRQLEEDGYLDDKQAEADSIREDALPGYGDLPETERRRIATPLGWILSPGMTQELESAAGPIAALRLVEKKARGLKAIRAARFLLHLGYPMIIPDQARRRWLQRFGLIEETGNKWSEAIEGLRLLLRIAEETSTPTAEVDLLLGVFTGSEAGHPPGIAYCRARPRCAECPLAGACSYANFMRRHGSPIAQKPEPRRLATTVLPEDRPREKLVREGPAALSNAELLAILLRTGNGRQHALELAHSLLAKAGSLSRLSAASIEELRDKKIGLGTVQAITIKAALELARRLAAPASDEARFVTCSRDVFTFLRSYFLEQVNEVLLCLLLNNRNRIMRQVPVTVGLVNQAPAHPREAFREAIRDSATTVIFVHNHPSGDPTPSREDRLITRKMVEAGDLVGIRVIDHIIIGRETHYSFADLGELRS